MSDIPKPTATKAGNERNADADCEKYTPIMGGYCQYYVTRNGECTIKFGVCDGFGVLKK